MSLWQLCPVCSGRGTVPAGFYGVAIGTGDERCRRCKGDGTILIPDPSPEEIRLREALNRIYQSGKGAHIEIAREALNG